MCLHSTSTKNCLQSRHVSLTDALSQHSLEIFNLKLNVVLHFHSSKQALMFHEGVRRGYLCFSRKYFLENFQVASKACMSKVGPGTSWDHLLRGHGCTAGGYPVLGIWIIQTCNIFSGWILVNFLVLCCFVVCFFILYKKIRWDFPNGIPRAKLLVDVFSNLNLSNGDSHVSSGNSSGLGLFILFHHKLSLQFLLRFTDGACYQILESQSLEVLVPHILGVGFIVGSLGLSWAWPGFGHNDPCGSLPAWDILWFHDYIL